MVKRASKKSNIKTHCSNGHAYDEVGYYVVRYSSGKEYWRCNQCHADRAKKARAKKRAENPPKPKVKRKSVSRKSSKPVINIDITESDCESFSVLSKMVNDKLEVVFWNLTDSNIVEHLFSGLPRDGMAIHVFSDEWAGRQKQCEGFIRAHAGLFERKVGARKCEVEEIPRGEAKMFLNEFHIQGANNLGIIYFGLRFEGELLGILSLGRHTRQIGENRIVLDRLCFKAGVQVVGGSSKLMKVAVSWAKKQSYDEIITFSDNRWTSGALYESLGFVLDSDLKPDYYYVQKGKRFSKQSQRKKNSKCPDGMTEFEWASYRGMKRIYDAGKKRWVMNLWPELHKTRNELSSQRCAEQHRNGVFKHSHIRGYFSSSKCGCSVYYASSYELRCLYLLEHDENVVSFRRCDSFKGEDSWRNPDLWIEFLDGSSEIWEVKPMDMLSNFAVQSQISESKLFAESKGVGFRVWTEHDSGLETCSCIIGWAKEYLKSIGDTKYSEHHKEVRKKIRERYYEKIKADQVEVWCDFCKENHTLLRLTYNRNIKKNGRYICIKENGHLVGKKSKDHLRKENPYAKDGKKECTACHEIKPFEAFDKRRASHDGMAFKCKKCAKEVKLKRLKRRLEKVLD